MRCGVQQSMSSLVEQEPPTSSSGLQPEPAPAWPNDWVCSACGMNNFARRRECFQCSALKGSTKGSMASASAHEGVPPDTKSNDASPVEKVPRNESEVDRSRRQTRLIKACGDDYFKAIELLETFKARSGADLYAFHAVIGVCSRTKQPGAAVEVLNSMSAYGVQPDARLYRSVFDACRNAGQWKRSLGLLRSMERSGGSGDDSSGEGRLPDLYAYNSSLLALARAGEWKPTLELLDQMESAPVERKLKPNVMSLGAAVSACAAAKKWKLCWQLVGAMDERGVQPNAAFYAALLGACNRSGQWDKALLCYSMMQARAGPPRHQAVAMDASVLRSALQACIEGKQAAQAEMALQHAVRDGVLLDLPLVDFALAALTHGEEGGLEKGMGRRLPNSTAPANGESAALGDVNVASTGESEGPKLGSQEPGAMNHESSSSSASSNESDPANGDVADAPSPYSARIEELRTLKAYLINRAGDYPPQTSSKPKKSRTKKNIPKKSAPSTPQPQEQLKK